MSSNEDYIEALAKIEAPGILPGETANYAEILQSYGLSYMPVDYYLQVGEIPWIQGWILHVSVIMSQLNVVFKAILPVLIKENVAFKIIRDKDTAKDLLDGHLEYIQLGKVLSIYPENGVKAHLLAKKMIELTTTFKGPQIPTDIHLGGCIFTRYGNGNAVLLPDETGKNKKFIHNFKGQLIPDPYTIPFVLPEGIRWPFPDIAEPKTPVQKRILKHIYRPISVLKPDPRGNVLQAVYLKRWLRTNTCVIKEGKRNMCSDEYGRDIRERLLWQQVLHRELENIVPLPKIIDFFEEEGDTYLVMEFIKGISLNEWKELMSGNCLGWKDQSVQQQVAVLECILTIIDIVQRLHQKGYVHRDITPVNFLVDPNGRISLIDIELAYSLKTKTPTPPFGLGTLGFMSPEQFKQEIPTVKEDIYGLCATILALLVGMFPAKFITEDIPTLKENLCFFIQDYKMARLIALGLNPDQQRRPELSIIRSTVKEYRDSLLAGTDAIRKEEVHEELDPIRLEKVIKYGIRSLVNPHISLIEGLWLSKSVKKGTTLDYMLKEHLVLPDLHGGIGGVLYFLGKVKSLGFDIEPCMDSYRKGWDFLQVNCLNNLQNMPPGLYSGAAGIALALAVGIKAGLLKDSVATRQVLQSALEREPVGFDLAGGSAGQGVATLLCEDYLVANISRELREKCIQLLSEKQQKDGSWLMQAEGKSKRNAKILGFSHGVAGITWFLLEYIKKYPDMNIQKVAVKSLNWLEKRTDNLKKLLSPPDYQKIADGAQVEEEAASTILLTFIKAYETLKDLKYQKAVEDILFTNPPSIVHNDFSQVTGLAGLGELYLEAGRVFGNEEWLGRAGRLANLFIHTSIHCPEGNCYWVMDQNMAPTADLIRGNSGILHFLIRYANGGKLGYRLLS
ncbi:MAG TPA: lanthionine synthetase LanC family protein [Puia sp.]